MSSQQDMWSKVLVSDIENDRDTIPVFLHIMFLGSAKAQNRQTHPQTLLHETFEGYGTSTRFALYIQLAVRCLKLCFKHGQLG